MLGNKGQGLSGLAMTVVIAIVMLFVGLFMISMVTGITGNLNDFNTVLNETHNLSSDPENFTVDKASVGDFVLLDKITCYESTSQTTEIDCNITNEETGEVEASSTDLSTEESFDYDWEELTAMQEVNNYIKDQTSTVFKVLVLVIIIVSLGVAINVLRGWGGTSAGQGGTPSV